MSPKNAHQLAHARMGAPASTVSAFQLAHALDYRIWSKGSNCTSNNDIILNTGSGWSNTYTCNWDATGDASSYDHNFRLFSVEGNEIEILKEDLIIKLPDGTKIHLKADGNFRIEDENAKVIYAANRLREFNPFVNAGDLVAKFIDFVRETVPTVRKNDVATLPLQLFIHWLIIEAATKDADPIPEDVVRPEKNRLLIERVRPRCLLPSCRRFVRRKLASGGFSYCNTLHAQKHIQLLGV